MEQQVLPQLFGLIPTGLPCITTPTSAPLPTSFIFTIPTTRPFSHIVVFLLPGITLPPNTAAAVYISLPPSPQTPLASQQPNFKFLGGIGPGKESAIFKISGLTPGVGNAAGGEVDMDAPEAGVEVTLGISLESAESVSAQMASLSTAQNTNNPSTALVPLGKPKQMPDSVVLAQRIIKNAFNFLASFSGNVNGGVEVVPLKAFEEWWKKFEGRIRSDPTFLERGDGE